MTFVAGAVVWAGYTLAWWGWLAVTDRVPAGQPNTLWWPSIRDLVSPGRMAQAVPPRLGTGPGLNAQAAAGTLPKPTTPLTGGPLTPSQQAMFPGAKPGQDTGNILGGVG